MDAGPSSTTILFRPGCVCDQTRIAPKLVLAVRNGHILNCSKRWTAFKNSCAADKINQPNPETVSQHLANVEVPASKGIEEPTIGGLPNTPANSSVILLTLCAFSGPPSWSTLNGGSFSSRRARFASFFSLFPFTEDSFPSKFCFSCKSRGHKAGPCGVFPQKQNPLFAFAFCGGRPLRPRKRQKVRLPFCFRLAHNPILTKTTLAFCSIEIVSQKRASFFVRADDRPSMIRLLFDAQ